LWRSSVVATPGRDRPELIQTAFEKSRLFFLKRWALEDSQRAIGIAATAKDEDRRRAGLAIVLPLYAKIDAQGAEQWRLQLERDAHVSKQLPFLVSMAKAEFMLGHSDDAQSIARRAWELGTSIQGDEGLDELRELSDICGHFWYGDSAWYSAMIALKEPSMRLTALSEYVRGAMRNRASFREPN
jgi:hypothetical protein